MAKIEHIKNKRGEVIYPVSKEGAIYDENGVLLSTKIATFITRLVDNLANYYLKSETYTKGEVDDLIGAIQGFTYIVVSELPTASAETMGIVYLVPSEDPQTQNVKDEYITIRSGVEGSYTYSWEQIGSTAIDLSGYVTTEALNTALADYTTTANLTTLLAGKQDTISDLATIRSGAAAGATAYQKPGTGIPATDMASEVQTSLGKADSAYQKPSGGIPKTDLESSVQGSLELADTAVQADPIGSIVPPVDPSEFATKEEVEGLEAKVDEKIDGKIDFGTWEVGTINYPSNGHIPDLASTTRIRADEKVIEKTGRYTLYCNSGYNFVLLVVNKESSFTWRTSFEMDLVEGDVYRVALKKNPDADFSGYTQAQVDDFVRASGFYMQGPGMQSELDYLSEEISDMDNKVDSLDVKVNGMLPETLSFTEYSGGYYDTSGAFVSHSGLYAEIDLSRYAGQKLALSISNASGSSTRATCLMVNGAVINYVTENETNFNRVWDIPANAILRESHSSSSTLSLVTGGLSPSVRTDTYVFPYGFVWQDNPLMNHIFARQNGKIDVDFDVASLKNSGGTTYYVSPTGNDSNDGLTPQTPLTKISTAIAKADVGTIVLASGVYNINRMPGTIAKSVNIVSATGAKPIIMATSGNNWAKEDGYNYVYKSTATNAWGVINTAETTADGDFKPYNKVGSISEVESTPGTYFTDENGTYIHADGAVPQETVWSLQNGNPILCNLSADETIYLEGLYVIGGNTYTARAINGGSGRPKFVAKNCTFGYTYGGNALHLMGVDSFCQDCVCCYSRNDGFNYHINSDNLPRSIELGCIGRSNGFKGFYPDGTANTDNGSTSHDGGVAIRINGQYYDNIGPNVADAGDGQQSLNLGCVAHHSKAESTQACGFQMNGDGAVMFCDTCSAFSNPYNFRAEAGTKVKMRNCAGEPTNAEGGEIWAY